MIVHYYYRYWNYSKKLKKNKPDLTKSKIYQCEREDFINFFTHRPFVVQDIHVYIPSTRQDYFWDKYDNWSYPTDNVTYENFVENYLRTFPSETPPFPSPSLPFPSLPSSVQ